MNKQVNYNDAYNAKKFSNGVYIMNEFCSSIHETAGIEDIRNISVSINQFTRNVELDTLYMVRNPGEKSEQTIKAQVGIYNPDSGEIVTYSGTFDYDNTSKENVINLYEIVNNNEVLESITK